MKQFNKRHLAIVYFIMSLFALGIAIYQFVDNRNADGALSLLFFAVFLAGGLFNRRKTTTIDSHSNASKP